MPGRIYPKGTLFLRTHVGTATSDKAKYDMTISMEGSPTVESKQTGKFYALSWTEIITMAVAAGIDKPEKGG